MSRKPVPVYTSEVVWPCFILIELITLIYQSNDEVTYPNNTSMGGGGVGGPQNSFGHARVNGLDQFSQIFKPGLKIYAD